MKTNRIYPEQELKVLNNTQENKTTRTLKSRQIVDISFNCLKYTVQEKAQQNQSSISQIIYLGKTILNDVTGYCPGGQITAILGSSGAGKTTLLNILAGRIVSKYNAKLTGQLQANGDTYDFNKFSQFASYVMQNDVLMETMTPKETFEFAANLKYSDPQIKQSRIADTIKCLKLEKCQNTIIGGITMKGISGGEKKRASIGYELVSNPSCLLLDEPTSGLDSFTAFQIIHSLKQLAEQQDRTIIFTIHQPSTDIFNMFDRIMLLVQGKFIYQGPKDQIVNYFGNIGFKCPDHSNPMDYYLGMMNMENPNNIEQFPSFFHHYQEQLMPQVLNEINNSHRGDIPLKVFETSQTYQIGQISSRAFVNFKRDPMQLTTRIVSAIFQGLIQGGVFYGIANNNGSTSELFSVAGSLFFLCVSHTLNAMLQVVLGFITERDVFLREENSKLYTALSYFIGKQFIEVPFCVIVPVIQELICYWMCGYNDQDSKYILIHLLISILLFTCSNSLGRYLHKIGLMVGCLFDDFKALTSITPMLIMPMILFSGYFANQKTLYSWIAWIQYTGPVTFAFQAISLNEYENRHYEIDPVQLYDFTIGLWECIGILAGYIFIIRIVAYIFLHLLKNKLQ